MKILCWYCFSVETVDDFDQDDLFACYSESTWHESSVDASMMNEWSLCFLKDLLMYPLFLDECLQEVKRFPSVVTVVVEHLEDETVAEPLEESSVLKKWNSVNSVVVIPVEEALPVSEVTWLEYWQDLIVPIEAVTFVEAAEGFAAVVEVVVAAVESLEDQMSNLPKDWIPAAVD